MRRSSYIQLLLVLLLLGVEVLVVTGRPGETFNPFPVRKKEQDFVARQRELRSGEGPTLPDDWGNYQGKGRDTNGAVKIVRAESMSQQETPRGLLTTLQSRVKFIQDSSTMWCDLAQYYNDLGELRLLGRVLFIDPQRTLSADEVKHYEDKQLTTARGNVKIYRDSVLLTCREGKYIEQGRIAQFYDHMEVYDEQRNTLLTGGMGTWEGDRERGEVPLKPVLTEYDSTGEEVARITSRFMAYDARYGIADARDSVTIRWEEVDGRSDRLLFYPEEDKALMIGEPVVWRDRDEARGDSIWLYLTDESIDSVEIFGDAVAFMHSDSSDTTAPRSWMRAFRIVMDFENGEVARMAGNRQARAVYHIFNEGEDQGSNQVSGDKITLLVEDREVSDVIVEGGTRGTYYPQRLSDKVRRDD
ncbi:hypothetical protein GF324_04180, partial [bacterium]|nr:hypothetical protein [bacterium]